MEDDKKKRRNKKKKKNKQTETMADDVAVSADQNHVTNEQNDDVRSQASEPAEIQNVEVDVDRHQSNGSAMLAEAERQHLLQREAVLEETLKQLRNERESHIQIEAALEETIKRLQNESDSHKEKVATLEEKIKQLESENHLHMQKEATLEVTIKQLQNQNDSQVQKEASLEEKIKLLEADKDSLTQMESISKEEIASLNVEITRLRMQVVELEDSRYNLLQENQQLKENICCLQSPLSSDEIKRNSEQEDFNTQIEAAVALIDKLITENIELVEKVNEVSVKLDKQCVIGSDAVTTLASDTEPMSESSDNMSSLNHRLETRGVVAVNEDKNHPESVALVINSSESDYSGEIVQIPLDDNEVQDLKSQVIENDTVAAVPLTDAPLIGAPFRLVSFVAKFVSGADLVNKNSSN